MDRDLLFSYKSKLFLINCLKPPDHFTSVSSHNKCGPKRRKSTQTASWFFLLFLYTTLSLHETCWTLRQWNIHNHSVQLTQWQTKAALFYKCTTYYNTFSRTLNNLIQLQICCVTNINANAKVLHSSLSLAGNLVTLPGWGTKSKYLIYFRCMELSVWLWVALSSRNCFW